MSILLRLGLVVCLVSCVALPVHAQSRLFEELPVGLDQTKRTRPTKAGVAAKVNLAALGVLDPGRNADRAPKVALDILERVGGKKVLARLKKLEKMPSGRFAWMGDLEGIGWSSVTLIIDADAGTITGNITYPEGTFEIHPIGGGVHELVQLDTSAFRDHETLYVPDAETQAGFDASAGSTVQTSSDSGALIDVMVLYTAAARTAAGGDTQIRSVVDLAVAQTNQSYANSGITPRLRLVHAGEVSYTEAGFSSDLTRLQQKTEGYMDDVHALRDKYGADMVALIVEQAGACGIGYIGGPSATYADWAFSVTARTCATGYFSFGHELGHNQGARHDRWVDGSENAPYTYNHGYVAPDASWRTIMAYANGCGWNCPRLQYWSNPDVSYNGVQMGVPEGTAGASDNRKTLNNTAVYVANFRQEVSTTVPGAATLTSPQGTSNTVEPTFTWAPVSGASQYYLWVQETGGAIQVQTWYPASAVCSAATCSTTPAKQLLQGRSYTWWVQTWNNVGYGPWSAAATFTVSAAVPGGTTLTAPASGATVAQPTFTWTKVSGASYYYFWLQPAGREALSKTWYAADAVCGATTCSITPTVAWTGGPTYQWWVQTWNSAGYGPWTAMSTFDLQAPPRAVTLFSPLGDIGSATPKFSWERLVDGTWYYLWISRNGTAVVKQWYRAGEVCTTTCSAIPDVTFEPGATYEWWVQSYGDAGYGAWSLSGTFRRQD